ncbi:MAG: hypothetical protein BHW56_07525 [Acetobacter sp. 46_36]|nr:MAG: hypothetical protein BHW56_07525 [Acetobacter sp. 46_36]
MTNGTVCKPLPQSGNCFTAVKSNRVCSVFKLSAAPPPKTLFLFVMLQKFVFFLQIFVLHDGKGCREAGTFPVRLF